MEPIELRFYDSEKPNKYVLLTNTPFFECAVETTASISIEVQGRIVNLEEKNARRLAIKILEMLN